MATKFMSGTELFMFECLMQQTPNMSRANQEEKRFKAQYIGVLKDYMREYGYGDIRKRALNSLDRFIFDEFIFCNTTLKICIGMTDDEIKSLESLSEVQEEGMNLS